MFNFDAQEVSVMAWNGSNGLYSALPEYLPYTAWRNTPAEAAMRDFMVTHANLPRGARLWTFGAQVLSRVGNGAGGQQEQGFYFILACRRCNDALAKPEALERWIDRNKAHGNRIGLDFNIKVYNPIRLPDSATLISIDKNGSSGIWYQAIDQYNHMLKLDNFGDIGKIIEGNFSGTFAKLQGCCPTSTVLDTVNISGEFLLRRVTQWWNH